MKEVPIDVRTLFKPLQDKLIQLIKSLDPEDWKKQTVAKKWKVKDVISHMLDGQLRVLSMQRDGYFGEQPPEFKGYNDLVQWINKLNNDWVEVSRRLSPQTIILLFESIGDQVVDYYISLNPWDEAVFSVDWAGEYKSYNWMHLAREYTEYWHHQQQVRDAVGMQGIMTKEFFLPVMNIFFQALPHTFRDVKAETGTIVEVNISSDVGSTWFLVKQPEKWQLEHKSKSTSSSYVSIPFDIAWILFTKSIRPQEIIDRVEIRGDKALARQVLEMVSVLA